LDDDPVRGRTNTEGKESPMTNARRARIIGSVIAAGVMLLMAGVGPASGQGWGHGAGPDGGVWLGVPLRVLNLTADQQTQVRAILSAARTSARPTLQQLQQAQSALIDTLLASPSADVSTQLVVINGLRSQLLQSRAQVMAQVLGVLTADQLARAAQVKTQLSQLRSQMRQLIAPAQP
jgi:Spy/CpxP family protein refolding chaperone